MRKTNEKTKLSRLLNMIVIGLMSFCFLWVMAAYFTQLSPVTAQNTPQTHTERAETTEGIFTPQTHTEPYSANQRMTLGAIETTAANLYEVNMLAAKIEAEPEPRYILTDEEKHMLCFVADNEDFTSVESRLAVMRVVMNRVESDKFPDTVTDVLYQRKQFNVMKRYSADYTPSDEAIEALELMLYEPDIFEGERAVFFSRADVPKSRIAKGLYLVAEVGGSKFYGQE